MISRRHCAVAANSCVYEKCEPSLKEESDGISDWRRALFVVFGKVGRPPIGQQLRELVLTMAGVNSLWRAPRIHDELLKLRIETSERTVSRILHRQTDVEGVEDPPSEPQSGSLWQ